MHSEKDVILAVFCNNLFIVNFKSIEADKDFLMIMCKKYN